MNDKGFTLVELLVVITIIGILASVILPRLNTAREGGIETKIIAELDSFYKLGMNEEIGDNSFNVVCGMNGIGTSTKLLPLADSLRSNSDQFVCNSTSGAFAASAQLNATEHWCVDNGGTKTIIPNALGPGVTQCT